MDDTRRKEPKLADTKYAELCAALANENLTPTEMARRMREAMDNCLKGGKIVNQKDPQTKQIYSTMVPDMSSYCKFMELWGKWMRVERANGPTAQIGINFGSGTLDETQRHRVESIMDVVESEVKRRGLPDVLSGGTEVEDAKTLPRVVGPSRGKEEASGGGAP